MKNLSKKQKIIIGIIAAAVLIVIIASANSGKKSKSSYNSGSPSPSYTPSSSSSSSSTPSSSSSSSSTPSSSSSSSGSSSSSSSSNSSSSSSTPTDSENYDATLVSDDGNPMIVAKDADTFDEVVMAIKYQDSNAYEEMYWNMDFIVVSDGQKVKYKGSGGGVGLVGIKIATGDFKGYEGVTLADYVQFR